METRKAKRFQASFKVDLKVDSAKTKYFSLRMESVEVDALDISALGIALLSNYFVPKGVIVDLQLKIGKNIVDVKGEIRSAVAWGKGQTRLGILFIDIGEPQLKAIKSFIKKNEKNSK